MKKFLIGWLCLLLAIISFALLLPFLLQFPADMPRAADAIVVLGGGGVERSSKAFKLYQAGFAKRFILPGAGSEDGSNKFKAPDPRATWLIGKGIPIQDIFILGRSPNSWMEAQRTIELMKQQRWDKVIVVSDPPHMLRLAYSWGKTFLGEQKEYFLVRTEPAWWSPWKWWENKESSNFIFDEVRKLGYYIIKY